MVEARIYLEKQNDSILWILTLTATVKQKLYSKSVKDIIYSDSDKKAPYTMLLSMIKAKEVKVFSNEQYIIDLFNGDNSDIVFETHLDKEKTNYDLTGLDDMKEVSNEIDPDVPSFVKVRLSELKAKAGDSEIALTISIAMNLMKIAGYFNEDETKTYEFPLFLDLKKEGLIKKDEEVEDIIMAVINNL